MRKFCLLLFAVSLSAFAQHDHRMNSVDMSRAPVLKGLGDIHHKVSTQNELAQKFFDQGLALDYAFNHVEAERAFLQAQKLDPQMAMAWWGQALVLGPNLNDPITPEREQKAYAAIQKAKELGANATREEKALIDALAERYSIEKDHDRAELDLKYAVAMAEVAKQYPDDPDARTLYGAAWMETMPWDYYEQDGKLKPQIKLAEDQFEAVIKRWPNHTGARHFYIHAVEASSNPERAEPSADVLLNLAPSAGHLVHMPSHIYVRVGKYDEAVDSNRKAIVADEDYITQCQAQGIYPAAYYPHNMHMLTFAASMEGNSKEAIATAKKMVDKVPVQFAESVPQLGNVFEPLPMVTLLRFGRWDEVLATPKPGEKLLVAQATWHYAHGVALIRTGKVTEAQQDLEAIKKIAADPELPKQHARRTEATSMVAVAQNELAGEIAASARRYDEAIAFLEKAVAAQDAIPYSEPENWYSPSRDVLGAVLLDANRPADAEKVYRKDLEQHRGNGWSLYGLAKSLRAQGKDDEAEKVEAQFALAWAHADVKLTASRF